jgi:hypothetical protein
MNILKKATLLLAAIMVFFVVNNASAEVSANSLDKSWGKPVSVIMLAGGVEKRVYGPIDVVVGYSYFHIKNGRVIEKGYTGVSHTDKIDGEKRVVFANSVSKPKKASLPEISGLMASHYKNNRTSVMDIKAKYGKPINKHMYANGMERFVFDTEKQTLINSNSENERAAGGITGYKYVIARDGRVLDEGFTRVLFNNTKVPVGPNVSPFMANWFKKHPQKVSSVTNKLGKPVDVKNYKNGMTRLIFGDKDVEVCSAYVIGKAGQVVDKGYNCFTPNYN